MKKTIFLTAASILLIFSLMGCNQNKTEETGGNTIYAEESDDSSIINQQEENTSSTVDDSNTEISSDTPVCITGIIQDAAMNTITIKTTDNVELHFLTEDADKSKCNGLLIGSSVDIFYTGQIEGTDTSSVTVTAMEQPNE